MLSIILRAILKARPATDNWLRMPETCCWSVSRRNLDNAALDKTIYAWLCMNDKTNYAIEQYELMMEKRRVG